MCLSAEIFFLTPADTNKWLSQHLHKSWFNFNTLFQYTTFNSERKQLKKCYATSKALGALTKISTELHTTCLDAPWLWIQVFLTSLLSYYFISTSGIFMHPFQSLSLTECKCLLTTHLIIFYPAVIYCCDPAWKFPLGFLYLHRSQ